MASRENLHKFLNNNRAEGVFSHTSLGTPIGKFMIGEDKRDEFYKLYDEVILYKRPVYITEKPQPIGPLRID